MPMSHFISRATAISCLLLMGIVGPVHAQSEAEVLFCEAAKTNRVVELVYDKDVSKGCEPRNS